VIYKHTTTEEMVLCRQASILHMHLVKMLSYLCMHSRFFGANLPFCSAVLIHSFRCLACFLSAKFIAYLYRSTTSMEGNLGGNVSLSTSQRWFIFHIFQIVSDISSDKWWQHHHPSVPLPLIPFKNLQGINQL